MKLLEMKAKLLIPVVIITIALAACSKDKFTAKPQLKFEGTNTGVLSVQGQQLIFNFTLTDKEGDVQDSIWMQRISKVCGGEGNNEISETPARYKLPEFTPRSNFEAEMTLLFNYKVTLPPPIDGCVGKNDTSYFRFWIRDTQKNVSDTITTPDIVFLN